LKLFSLFVHHLGGSLLCRPFYKESFDSKAGVKESRTIRAENFPITPSSPVKNISCCLKMRFASALLALAATVLPSSYGLPHDNCNAAFFNHVLPANASTLLTYHVAAGGTFGQAADIAYPSNATNLPELCAVIINVTSSATSSFTFDLFLPNEWNERFITVGNGGFSGGINWYSMGSVAPYGFATVSTDTGHNSTGQE
jgi:feruloyl esterase